MKTRKPWREKMENPNLPRLVDIPANMRKRLGTGTMVIPHPREVDALIRDVPAGSLLTSSHMTASLARRHGADTTCAMATGRFVRIAAEAADEEERAGAAEVTPYWRVVKDDGSLNPKFPGGAARQAKRLREEGHRILPGSGKKPPRVANVAAVGV